jgi:hypothetical protein
LSAQHVDEVSDAPARDSQAQPVVQESLLAMTVVPVAVENAKHVGGVLGVADLLDQLPIRLEKIGPNPADDSDKWQRSAMNGLPEKPGHELLFRAAAPAAKSGAEILVLSYFRFWHRLHGRRGGTFLRRSTLLNTGLFL